VKLDGRQPTSIRFDARTFDKFRHGYAGTIYRGQGRTLDQTYLYHSEHWRSAASYVALTRHRDKTALFVARNTAPDVKQLARQMARTDDRRAASMFHHAQDLGPVRPLTPGQMLEHFAKRGSQRRDEADRSARINAAAARVLQEAREAAKGRREDIGRRPDAGRGPRPPPDPPQRRAAQDNRPPQRRDENMEPDRDAEPGRGDIGRERSR